VIHRKGFLRRSSLFCSRDASDVAIFALDPSCGMSIFAISFTNTRAPSFYLLLASVGFVLLHLPNYFCTYLCPKSLINGPLECGIFKVLPSLLPSRFVISKPKTKAFKTVVEGVLEYLEDRCEVGVVKEHLCSFSKRLKEDERT
jgi:hypothetical protein